jgi:hypothetical protein
MMMMDVASIVPADQTPQVDIFGRVTASLAGRALRASASR